MTRLCSKCGKRARRETKCRACGADVAELLTPDEQAERFASDKEPKRARDVGATVGAMVSDGNPLAIAAGYFVGKLVEAKKLVSFAEVVPDPPKRDIVGIKLKFRKKRKKKALKKS